MRIRPPCSTTKSVPGRPRRQAMSSGELEAADDRFEAETWRLADRARGKLARSRELGPPTPRASLRGWQTASPWLPGSAEPRWSTAPRSPPRARSRPGSGQWSELARESMSSAHRRECYPDAPSRGAGPPAAAAAATLAAWRDTTDGCLGAGRPRGGAAGQGRAVPRVHLGTGPVGRALRAGGRRRRPPVARTPRTSCTS